MMTSECPLLPFQLFSRSWKQVFQVKSQLLKPGKSQYGRVASPTNNGLSWVQVSNTSPDPNSGNRC